ncbi:MAG: hypothetical protein QOF28_2660 [Actinomycetota bacterium]|nr:hypothetical protein [Actinomycetota bacterium]
MSLLASARSAGHPIWHLAVVALGAIGVFVGIKIREHLDAHERARSKPARLARGGLLFTLVLCSAGAATIHAVVCPEHFREYVAFGAFFVVAAALQGAWAVAALLRPTRALLVVGAAGNAAVILVWAVSRTAGLPIGPEVWQPEAISVRDVVATLLEVGVVLGASFLLTRREATAPRSAWRASHFVS